MEAELNGPHFGEQMMGNVALGGQIAATSAGFQDLALPLFDSLYNFAHWLTGNRQDAEDLVQETYLKALKAFSSFHPGTNFRVWIFQILRNTFLTSRSSLVQRMTVPLSVEDDRDLQATTSHTAESILIACSDVDAVRHAIEQLPVVFREVILLSDVEELSYREIAGTLSIPIGTVMSRLARARRAIRSTLGKASSMRRTQEGSCARLCPQGQLEAEEGSCSRLLPVNKARRGL
jgi:RNA polymerase sigma-70 factor, ECF subfamily